MSENPRFNACPVCDGACCVICHDHGTDESLDLCIPYAAVNRPWEHFERGDLIPFLRRVYNAAPQASRQQVRDLVESYYIAAALGAVTRRHRHE